MASDRVQRQIDRFLDEAEEAAALSDWARVRDRAQNVLAFDPENNDGIVFLAAAARALGGTADMPAQPQPTATTPKTNSDRPDPTCPTPTHARPHGGGEITHNGDAQPRANRS